MSAQQPIVIFTAPSGAGKTSIVRYLLDRIPELSFSVSAATRAARKGEVDGRDYYFLPLAVFQQRIQENAFAEWEMVYEGKYYGTLRSELERIWALGKVPVLDIDVKGAIHVQQQYPLNTLSVFVQPPGVEELKKRLLSRGTETPESLETRLNKAEYEMSFQPHFKATIVNRELVQACVEAEALIRGFLRRFYDTV
ncbi:guanylate kinase [Dinghuibacter silviterrae]|uniref:Guanylate kinase n=2 Tax=Dinghuibacter silviterrae TaxID=1539049 RepID=A0A4V3GLK0_9BACT|nr:guanylate kinase [Dinghuibacter silviterrae]